MQENNYCVYKHTSPSGKVYIGITSLEPEKRWKSGKGYPHNKYFTNAINRYGWENFTHEILFTELSKEEACQKETELIAFYKSNQREFGYNLEKGGYCGSIMSDETKRKISESSKGRKHTEEAKRKVSEANKGHEVSIETRKKISESHKGKTTWNKGTKGICKPNAGSFKKGNTPWNKGLKGKRGELASNTKPVIQYDLSFNKIAIFISAIVACEKTGLPMNGYGNISACCRGKRKTAYGYIWRYAE